MSCRSGEGAGLAGTLLLLALLLACQPSSPTEFISLRPGLVQDRAIVQGRPSLFLFDLAADQFLDLSIEQRGIDVVVELLDPAGRLLYEIDSPSSDQGLEPVLAVAPVSGVYSLRVSPLLLGAAGRFTLAVHENRPAGPAERVRAATAGLLARAEMDLQDDDFEAAVAGFRAALIHLGPRETRETAFAEWRLGTAQGRTGALRESAALLERSADRYRRLGDSADEARVRSALGSTRRQLGEPALALEAHQRALDLYRREGDHAGEATSIQSLGTLLEGTGQIQKAIVRFEEALALRRRIGDRPGEASALQRLGNLYVLIGHDAEGQAFLQKALKLRAGEEDSRARISILIDLGWAEHLVGQSEEALERFDQAVALARSTGDRLSEAAALDRQGTAFKGLGRLGEAESSYRKSLEISRAADSPFYQGHTLANLGWLLLETNDVPRARKDLRQAVELLVKSEDPNGEVDARVGLSRAARLLGDFGPARQEIDTAIRRVEELRTNLRGEASRGQFIATRYDAFEELVTLLMDLDRREPGRGHAREALEVAERARARNLLEQLPPLPGDGGAMGEGGRGGEVLQSLAGRDTLLVVYLLAEPESFAWTVDRERIVPHVLPGRETIETLARRLAAALPRSHEKSARGAAGRAANDLAEAILTPLAERLAGRRRLVILPDGALNLVAFSGLPAPPRPGAVSADGRGGRGVRASFLLDDHEIAVIPSATVLLRQRQRFDGRPAASRELAILADPVFSLADPRLHRGRPGAIADERGDPSLDLGPLARLPFSGEEANAIARLVPEEERLLVLGAAATRELVMSGALSRFRILHFATHGLLHPVLPERSGLVLSLFDGQGRPREGFLAAPDVATLDLPADLVVLSACRSGLGREVRGEGLVGLTQAFFRAGARAVIVSSWDVRDRTTADLMTRFYTHHLAEGLPPAAALRKAQLALRDDPATAAPSFWAGFTLHGDWR